MEINLLNSAKEFFNDEVLSKLGNSVGEDKEKVKSAIGAIVPTLFLGLQKESGSGLTAIVEKAKQYYGDFNFGDFLKTNSETGRINGLVDSEPVEPHHNDLLKSIFGDKFNAVVSTLGGLVGGNGATVEKLLSVSLPAVFSGLTQNGTNWDASAIGRLLDENKQNFAAALPSGLSLDAFGSSFAQADQSTGTTDSASHDKPIEAILASVPLRKDNPQITHPEDVTDEAVSKEEELTVVTPPVVPPPHVSHDDPLTARPPVVPPIDHVPIIPPPPTGPTVDPLHTGTPSSGGGGIWKLLIPIAIIAVLWFLFGKGCKGDKDQAALTDSVNTTAVDTGLTVIAVTPVVRESLEVILPDGVILKAYKGGIEDQLVQFLKTDYKALSEDELKDKWFNFDNLNFETGTATVLPESQIQLENLAAILKAFPAATIKIGGYTDKTGNEDFNKKLSTDRANVVKVYLVGKGPSAQVIGAEGYGSEFAKAAADAPESERVLDRIVAVSVR
jgi:outer membrane protein OmpA-like peptidoglycan-associated protein